PDEECKGNECSRHYDGGGAHFSAIMVVLKRGAEARGVVLPELLGGGHGVFPPVWIGVVDWCELNA
ncbi:MAG: hypothetical protein EBY84_07105, partial [Acidimicrobiia bacterium]|nr:hypothetical protein [Acidimicrobiia bacterium]